MTNEQLATFIVANAATIFVVLKWGMKQAIDYTHKIRDIKELQDFKIYQEKINEKNETDHKGLSMKIDGKRA